MTPSRLRFPPWAALCAAAICTAASWAAAISLLAPLPAAAQTTYEAQELEVLRGVKAEQQALLMRGARMRFERARRRHIAKTYRLHYGSTMKPRLPVDAPHRPTLRPGDPSLRARPATALFVPNVAASNPADDVPPGDAAQAEPSVAAHQNNVLAAWNDGNGLQFGATQLQGYGYSTDGGATFTDGGEIPAPSSARWLSDPVVTVNEKTGEFYYCGLISPSAGNNGLAVMRGTFSGSNFSWDTPHYVRTGPDIIDFFDKPWIVADSSSGNLYVTYTHFVSSADSIIFQRSTDKGVTWGPMITLSSAAASGFVQGSRPAVGPNGEIYTTWSEIGPVDADFIRMRVSSDRGASFGSEQTVTTFYDNFGTGAPGFNRERSISFPTIGVDRTRGPNRGRVYIGWNESLNWFDDLLATGTAGTLGESGSHGSPGSAQSFAIGQKIVGSFLGVQENDYYRFEAIQGTSYIFWCDNATSNFYLMRVLCTDGDTRLSRAGDIENPPGNQAFMVWTAPTTGTYYFWMRNIQGSSPGNYTVRTGVALSGAEHGRDQRDVFVTSSTNGSVWSTPTRVNDDAPYYDNWLPEVAVGGDGNVYATWYDWRDTPTTHCGGFSNLYFGLSSNGAGSWVSLGPVTDAMTPWTDVESNVIPNQGDYTGLYANSIGVYACWADGRLLNPNVMAAVVPLAPDSVQVTVVTASAEPDRVTLSWENVASLSFEAKLDRSVAGGSFTVIDTLQSDGAGRLTYVDTDVTSGTQYGYRLRITASGTEFIVGAVSLTVPKPKLALTGTRPNPVRTATVVSFDIPAPGGNVELAVFDGTGRKVRVLLDQSLPPGPRAETWDLRDDAGVIVPAGMYFAQLRFGGEKASRRIVVIP